MVGERSVQEARLSAARRGLEELVRGASAPGVQAWAREHLEGFLRERVSQGAGERDLRFQCLPRGLFGELARAGLVPYMLPEAAGGLGGNRRTFGLILEQLGSLCPEVELPSLLSLFGDLPNLLCATGRADLLERYVGPMARGECLPTFAYTEANDVSDFRTTVTYRRRRCIIDGEKSLVTGGAIADVFLTYVKGEHGLELFLLERTDPGVEVAPVHTMGFRAAGLTKLVLRGVEVPEERRIVGSDGLGHVQCFLNNRRLFVVCAFPGRMGAIVRSCAAHLDTVIRDGRPLTEAQNVQARLGRMYARWRTAEAVLHRALDHWTSPEHDEVFDPVVAAAKYTVAELAMETAQDAVRMTGWMGYSDQLPYERDLRSFMGAIAGQTAQEKLEILLGINSAAHATMRGPA